MKGVAAGGARDPPVTARKTDARAEPAGEEVSLGDIPPSAEVSTTRATEPAHATHPVGADVDDMTQQVLWYFAASPVAVGLLVIPMRVAVEKSAGGAVVACWCCIEAPRNSDSPGRSSLLAKSLFHDVRSELRHRKHVLPPPLGCLSKFDRLRPNLPLAPS